MRWREVAHEWGTTAEERALPYPCDAVLPDANRACYRAIDVAAPAPVLFRWLCQLRVAPYSYDWIDNLGRRSPPTLTPGLEQLELGQRFMVISNLVSFETNRHVTLQFRSPGLFPPLAVTYQVNEVAPGRSRLVAKLSMQLDGGLRHRLAGWLLPYGDWVMMRKQFLTLKRYAERSASE